LHELEDEIDQDEAPAHVEDADDSEYAVDALGDVDDLGVHDYAAPTPKRPGKR
jgi:Mg2+/Co2+ transporter CorC